MWGIDVIGAIEPKVSNEHRFILFVIDYFTKWVEAASYANVTRNYRSKVSWRIKGDSNVF